MMQNLEKKHCPNCGAPITTEICPYYGVETGIDTRTADMEYPVIECKEAHIGFWTVVFPMIFAVSFGFFGLIMPIGLLFDGREKVGSLILTFGLFGIIGIVAFVIAIKPIIRYFQIQIHGKEIEATVYGYMNDNVHLNDLPAQIVKLLLETKEGPRFILYQLGDVKQPYKINSKIKLKVYQDKFLIVKDKKYYFE